MDLHKDFAQVETGMLKRDVLAILDTPTFTDRKDSIDRWYYNLLPEDMDSTQEIHFRAGKVIYKGPKQQPVISAEDAEAIKALPSGKIKPYIRTTSDKELKRIIKRDLKKEKKKSKSKEPRYEQI